jgi:hypothetical protein
MLRVFAGNTDLAPECGSMLFAVYERYQRLSDEETFEMAM